MKRRNPRFKNYLRRSFSIPDRPLFFLALAASLLGLLFVFDAGYARSMAKDHQIIPGEFLSQIIFIIPSVILGALVGGIVPRTWKRGSKLVWMLSFVLVILVEVIGTTMNGAQRWIKVGPISFQPAEIAKVATIVYLAGVFADRKAWVSPKCRDWGAWLDTAIPLKFRRVLPGLWVLLAVGFVEHEPDLGTAAVIAATAFAMCMIGGVTWKSLSVGVAIAVLGAWVLMLKEPYRMERFVNHGDRWEIRNVEDIGFQTVQSEAAMASGHLLGVGFGNGRAKHILPATTTDFIMATVAEETGFIGAALMIGLIAAIVWRLQFVAKGCDDRFSYLFIMGVAWWLTIQTCVNVMMANAFLPAIGIPFPFISSGGSSLVALWVALGICQSCVAASRTEEAKEKETTLATDRDGWRNGRARLSRA